MALFTLASSAPTALAATPTLAWLAHAVFVFGVLGVAATVYITSKPRSKHLSQD